MSSNAERSLTTSTRLSEGDSAATFAKQRSTFAPPAQTSTALGCSASRSDSVFTQLALDSQTLCKKSCALAVLMTAQPTIPLRFSSTAAKTVVSTLSQAGSMMRQTGPPEAPCK